MNLMPSNAAQVYVCILPFNFHFITLHLKALQIFTKFKQFKIKNLAENCIYSKLGFVLQFSACEKQKKK